mgnify:CR=1 FL=1
MSDKLYDECKDKSLDEIMKDLEECERGNEEYKKGYYKCDVARLFVGISYLTADNKPENKDEFRKEAYLAFFKGNRGEFTKTWDYIDFLTGNKNEVSDKTEIKILKGGSYKIKNYYLENFELQEIRGASALLSYVEETRIPDIISDRYIQECIVYCGGGNIFALLPEDCDNKLTIELEDSAHSILISANIAYYLSEPIPLQEVFSEGYKSKMEKIEEKLEERKKMKVFVPVQPKANKKIVIPLDNGEKIEIDGNGKSIKDTPEKKLCTSCGQRPPLYESSVGDEKIYLCTSCFYKRQAGRESKYSKYHSLYKKYNSCKIAKEVKTLSDIDGEHIAVVYGDGNNIGGIIQQFKQITQMMKFSRNVKNISEKAVFEAMGKHNIDKFEIVGLGGDDIFIIIPGKKAIQYAVTLIDLYNKESAETLSEDKTQKSTLSVGVAIGKTKMPINILLEVAKGELKKAKHLSKQQKDDCGSLSYVIMDSYVADEALGEKNGVKNTLLPFSHDVACKVLNFVKEIKTTGEYGKTKIQNILDAFENAESIEEANLYLEYMNAKRKKNEKAIELKNIDPYEICGGYYKKGNVYYYIWRDILDLLEFTEWGDAKK